MEDNDLNEITQAVRVLSDKVEAKSTGPLALLEDPKKLLGWLSLAGALWAGFGYVSRVASAPDEVASVKAENAVQSEQLQVLTEMHKMEEPMLNEIQANQEHFKDHLEPLVESNAKGISFLVCRSAFRDRVRHDQAVAEGREGMTPLQLEQNRETLNGPDCEGRVF